jgi:mRNA degradation ribonuclease J1/J2
MFGGLINNRDEESSAWITLAETNIVVSGGKVTTNVTALATLPDKRLTDFLDVTRGFVYVKESEELLEELRNLAMDTVDHMSAKRRRDQAEVNKAVRSAVSTYLFKHTKRSPMIIPMVVAKKLLPCLKAE